jgi:hypothetical protein
MGPELELGKRQFMVISNPPILFLGAIGPSA